MKSHHAKAIVVSSLLAASFLLSPVANCQERKLPDGTIIYSDGTRKLPNGTIIYKGGSGQDKEKVIYSGDVNHTKSNRKNKRMNKTTWLPPGQAKKIYGRSAKNYAPGKQKSARSKG